MKLATLFDVGAFDEELRARTAGEQNIFGRDMKSTLIRLSNMTQKFNFTGSVDVMTFQEGGEFDALNEIYGGA